MTFVEFGWLDDLGKVEPSTLVRRLRGISRFVTAEQLPDVQLPAAIRERLIERLGAWGIHLTCEYLRSGLSEDEIRVRLVADSGITCAARLGLSEDTPVWNLSAAAERLAAKWARRECDPTLNKATVRAARTIRRSYDQIAHQISQAQDLLTMTGGSASGGILSAHDQR